MRTRPADLSDGDVAGALRAGWHLEVEELEYAAVGFGSHHWHARGSGECWFVTVDGRDPTGHHGSALEVACALRDTGLEFVVAPVVTHRGHVAHELGEYAVTLYPHVDGQSHEFGRFPDDDHRRAVLDRLADVHNASGGARAAARVDDLAIPCREGLEACMSGGSDDAVGPYAADAAELIRHHAPQLRRALALHDERVVAAESATDRLVVTHGEPHPGNTISTGGGVVLVDWDTARLALPERDLWWLLDEDPGLAHEYETRTGVRVDETGLALFRSKWDLTDIALFCHDFTRPHDDTDDMRLAWASMRTCLARLG